MSYKSIQNATYMYIVHVASFTVHCIELTINRVPIKVFTFTFFICTSTLSAFPKESK